MLRAIILFTFFLITAATGHTQTFYGGLFPEIAVSTKIGKGYKYTFKVESMHGLFFDNEAVNKDWNYFHDRTDLQTFISHKLTPFQNLTLGMQYRVEEGHNTFRSIQQISFVVLRDHARMGHRIRADQTYLPDASDQYRIRYRFSYEKPLQGLDLNPGEIYLILSDEVIYSYVPSESDMENRINIAIGYYQNATNKFQIGIDFRTDKILEPGSRNRAWLKMGWYTNI
ncbi:MAG: DUF2490 domain-containing protein [Saprospiraceae bacterium]|nr:DUF2490 domain-containing protein [Saprospiraceae bacterium]